MRQLSKLVQLTMPRHTPHAHWFLIPLVMAVMLIVYIWECNRVRVIEQHMPPVQCDPFGDIARSVRDSAWRNPMDGRPSDMPGGLR